MSDNITELVEAYGTPEQIADVAWARDVLGRFGDQSFQVFLDNVVHTTDAETRIEGVDNIVGVCKQQCYTNIELFGIQANPDLRLDQLVRLLDGLIGLQDIVGFEGLSSLDDDEGDPAMILADLLEEVYQGSWDEWIEMFVSVSPSLIDRIEDLVASMPGTDAERTPREMAYAFRAKRYYRVCTDKVMPVFTNITQSGWTPEIIFGACDWSYYDSLDSDNKAWALFGVACLSSLPDDRLVEYANSLIPRAAEGDANDRAEAIRISAKIDACYREWSNV